GVKVRQGRRTETRTCRSAEQEPLIRLPANRALRIYRGADRLIVVNTRCRIDVEAVDNRRVDLDKCGLEAPGSRLRQLVAPLACNVTGLYSRCRVVVERLSTQLRADRTTECAGRQIDQLTT